MALNFTTTQTGTFTSLNSLASSTTTGVAASATIAPSTTNNVVDHIVTLEVTCPAHTPSSTTNILLWVVPFTNSEAATEGAGAQSGSVEDFNDGDSAETIDVDGNNMYYLGAIHCHTASVVMRSKGFSIAAACGYLPPRYAIVAQNQLGTTLPASGHALEYREVYYN